MDEQNTAKRIVSLLDDNAQNLNTDSVAKLDVARHRAVDAHMRLRAAPALGVAGFAHTLSNYFEHHRAAMSSGLAFGALLIAFLVVQPFSQHSNERSDAFLLGSELPPEAYADKGFDTWVDLGS